MKNQALLSLKDKSNKNSAEIVSRLPALFHKIEVNL